MGAQRMRCLPEPAGPAIQRGVSTIDIILCWISCEDADKAWKMAQSFLACPPGNGLVLQFIEIEESRVKPAWRGSADVLGFKNF